MLTVTSVETQSGITGLNPIWFTIVGQCCAIPPHMFHIRWSMVCCTPSRARWQSRGEGIVAAEKSREVPVAEIPSGALSLVPTA